MLRPAYCEDIEFIHGVIAGAMRAGQIEDTARTEKALIDRRSIELAMRMGRSTLEDGNLIPCQYWIWDLIVPVGFALVRELPGVLELCQFFIAEEFRREYYGSDFICALKHRYPGASIRVRLSTNVDSSGAIKFFKYHRFGELPSSAPSCLDLLFLAPKEGAPVSKN